MKHIMRKRRQKLYAPLDNEIKVTDRIVVKDRWLWSQIKIVRTHCSHCGDNDCITIYKGEDLSKLIKALQKLNYKGMPKK